MKHSVRFILTSIGVLFFSFFLVPKQAFAMEFRNSDATVTVGSGETVVGSLFATGKTIQIDGVVDGDVYCVGQTVLVKGSVNGDVICAGQTLEVNGTVAGSIRVAGQTVTLNGYIGRNVTALGQNLSIGDTSVVIGDVVSAGQTITLGGVVRKGFLAAGETALINGTIGGDTNFMVNSLQLGDAAKVSGTLTYQSDKDAVIATSASVGTIVKKPLPKRMENGKNSREKLPKMWGAMQRPWPVSAVGSIITFFLLSVVFIFLFPGKTERVVDMVSGSPGKSFLVGLLTFIITPIIFVTLLITIIGIPLAILLMLLFALMAFVSKLFVALWVGRKIHSSFMKKKGENWYLAAAIGVTVSYLVFHLPMVGWLISIAAVFIGMGGMVGIMFSKGMVKKGRK